MEALGRPAMNQFGQDAHLFRRHRQAAFGVSRGDPQTVIDSTIERGRTAQKFRVFPLEVAHFFDDVDALRRIQYFEENACSFQAQIHQRKINIVVTAAPRLERIASALLFL